VAVGVALSAVGGAVAAAKEPRLADALEGAWEQVEGAVPPLRTHPRLVAAGLGTLVLGGAYWSRWGWGWGDGILEQVGGGWGWHGGWSGVRGLGGRRL
jgi:hypothetical protein